MRTIASAIVELDRFLGIGVGTTVGFGITWISLKRCRRQIGVAWLNCATLEALPCLSASESKIRATPYNMLYDVPHIFLHSVLWPRHA